MGPRSTLKVLTTVLLVTSLSACFKAATSSVGNNTRIKSKTTALTVAETSQTKSVAGVSFNATDTQTINVGKDSALAGTSVTFAPGSLNISTDIIVEEGASFLDSGMSDEMGLDESQTIATAGAGVIVRPSTEAVLNKPLQLSLPLPGTTGLRLANTYYAISYKYLDPNKNQLITGIKSVDGSEVKITFDESAQKDVVQFTGYFGIYWVVTLARDIPKAEMPEPKVSLNPVVNKANVPVIASNGVVKESEIMEIQAKPEIVWTKPVLAFTAATRKVSLSTTMTSKDFKNCRAEFNKAATDLSGLILDLGELKTAEILAPAEKTQLVARYRCLDTLDRLTASPWSDAVSIPAVASTPTTPPVTPPVVTPPAGGGGTTPTPPVVDTTPPTVLGVSSPMADGTYSSGQLMIVTVSFSEPVQVTGMPSLAMQVGSPSAMAVYESGSGTSALVFQFTTVAGQYSSDLDYISSSSLVGDIKDLAGNPAILTLPTPGSAGSLSAAKTLVIDNTPAMVTGLSAANANGIYTAGSIIDISIEFNKPVFVTGSPTLTINVTPLHSVSYLSGHGSTILQFRYTIQNGDVSPLLDVSSANALLLGGATIKDSSGLNANITLPIPGSPQSLGVVKTIEIAGNSDTPNLIGVNIIQNAVAGTAIQVIDVNNSPNGMDQTLDGRPISYQCRFDNTANNSMDGGGNDCGTLPGMSFNPSMGILNWVPNPSTIIDPINPTVFEFKIMGTNTANLLHWVYAQVSVIKPFSTMVGFDPGTIGQYSFDPMAIEFDSGFVRLKAKDQRDDSPMDFMSGGATPVGLAYHSGLSKVLLDNSGGCNGQTTNCIPQDPERMPGFANIILHAPFESGLSPFQTGSSNEIPTLDTNNRKIGNSSVAFDGDDYLKATNSFANDFTINFWVRSSDAYAENGCANWWDGRPLVSTNTGGPTDLVFGISLCEGRISAGVSSLTPQIIRSGFVNDNAWHMVSFTRLKVSGLILLYIDGLLQASAISTVDSLNASAYVYLGYDPANASHFQGNIDEFTAWNLSLVAADIATLHAQQSVSGGGFIQSRVFDAGLGSPGNWQSLAIRTSMPFGKEILDNTIMENLSDYPEAAPNLNSMIRGLWHLNEISGSYMDTGMGGPSGSVVGTLGRDSPGRFGKAPTFSGSGHINLGAPSSLEFGSGSFTIGAWFRSPPGTERRAILTNGYESFDRGFTLEMINNQLAFGICKMGGSPSTCVKVASMLSYADNRWHHVIVTVDTSMKKIRMYIDGKIALLAQTSDGTCGNLNANTDLDFAPCSALDANRSNSMVTIGASQLSSPTHYWLGQIDEVATWARALSQTEALQLYRRGANRFLVQVRTCPTPDCMGMPYRGPDGTTQTYFSELNNNPMGPALPTGPNFVFSNYPSLSLMPNRYFQYRLVLESDDKQTLCNYAGATNCSPEVLSVSVGPEHFPTDAPAITQLSGIPYYTLQNISTSYGPETCPMDVGLNISRDGANWYYFTGSSWVPAAGGVGTSMNPMQMNAGIPTFAQNIGPGNLYIRSFLKSDGQTPCSLDAFNINGNGSFF